MQNTGGVWLGCDGRCMKLLRECGQRGDHALIGAGVAGEPGNDVHIPQIGEGLGEGSLGPAEVLWEIEQHRPQRHCGRRLFADYYRRCQQEVGGVVPARLKLGDALAVKTDHVLDEAGGQPKAGEGRVADVTKGRHGLAERTGCSGMAGNGFEDAGVGVEATADGGGGHRTCRGASARCGQGRCGDLLGKTGQRGEIHAGDAIALVAQSAGQKPAGNNASDVVRHQHRHRSHRVVALDLFHHCTQGIQRQPTVWRRRHLNGHLVPPRETVSPA